MYNLNANLAAGISPSAASSVINMAADDNWQEDVIQAIEMAAEHASGDLYGIIQQRSIEMAANLKDVTLRAAEASGLDQNAAALLMAVEGFQASIGMGDNLALAGESFESEAARLNSTVLAGEAMDIKGKLDKAWKWIKEQYAKFRAFLAKFLGGASRMSKAFEAVSKKADTVINDGKTLGSGKLDLSKAEAGKLTVGAWADIDKSKLEDLVKNFDELADDVYTKHKTVVGALESPLKTLIESEVKATDIDTFISAIDTANNSYSAAVKDQNGKATVNNGIYVAAYGGSADSNLTTAKAVLTGNLMVRKQKDGATAFTDKQMDPLKANDVKDIAVKAQALMDRIAGEEQKTIKGWDKTSEIDSIAKSISNLDKEKAQHAAGLNSIATTVAKAYDQPIGPFTAEVIGSMGTLLSVLNKSLGKHESK